MSALAQVIPFQPADAVRLLIVSESTIVQQELAARLSSANWSRQFASSGAHALEKLLEDEFELLLLDPALPDITSDEFQSLVRIHSPRTKIVCLDPQTGMPDRIDEAPPSAARLTGVHREGTLPLPFDGDACAEQTGGLPGVIGNSECMRKLYRICHLLAPRDTTVLIEGQSGTGKDVVAQAIHQLSHRRANSFVVINCAAIPESLLEAELFGYQKGAFTGAVQSRIGRLHAAHGGTLFLDEVGEIPLGLQAKLLRFLEQGELQRLGSSETYRVDTRVIAATNSQLKKMVGERQFREDLYYRLAVFPIELPPLRERLDDLMSLALNFLAKSCRQRVSILPDALALLRAHQWPGNVRELRNVVERAAILAGAGNNVGAQHIVI